MLLDIGVRTQNFQALDPNRQTRFQGTRADTKMGGWLHDQKEKDINNKEYGSRQASMSVGEMSCKSWDPIVLSGGPGPIPYFGLDPIDPRSSYFTYTTAPSDF